MIFKVRRLTFCSSLVLWFTTAQAQQTTAKDFLWYDPARIVTAEPCGECHASEYDVWKKTKHATGFETMHRKKSAEEIATAMGFRLIKRESLCLKCHYLSIEEDARLRAASGVSCESCHGAAKNWIDIHNNYGKGSNYQTETSEHKTRRILQSKANGMFRPSELYDVVANCFQCHTVPHESLVNVGGHTTGSDDFEFVEGSGQIQHNFLQAQFDARNTQNRDRSPERKRIMYVVGRTVDLEYSLRGAAMAQENGEYLRGMQQRIQRAIDNVEAISKRAPIPEVEAMLRTVESVEISSAGKTSLLDLAERTGGATRRFIAGNDGSRLSAIDELIQGRGAVMATFTKNEPDAIAPDIVPFELDRDFVDQSGRFGYVTAMCLNVRTSGSSNANVVGFVFKGERLAVQETRDNWSLVTNASGDVSGWVSLDHISSAPVTPDFIMPEDYGDPKTPTVVDGISASYVGVAVCQRCHNKPSASFPQGQFGVWRNHFHSAAFESLGKSYALAFAQKRRVGNPQKDWRCVKCHVTAFGVPASRLAPTYREEDGVGCEACHGPAGNYLEPHTDPNFDKEKLTAMGFRVFKDLDERDKLCRSCHNELSPTYKPFDVASFSAVIRHWEMENNDTIAKFSKAIAQGKDIVETPTAFDKFTARVASPTTEIAAGSPEPVTTPLRPRLAGIPDDWRLNTRGTRGRVFFPHFKHLDKFLAAGTKQEVCQVCHHTTAAGARPTNCSSGCHLFTITEVSRREDAFHGTCRTCHRQEKRGPQQCSECHVQ
jgi:hypothetical protein